MKTLSTFDYLPIDRADTARSDRGVAYVWRPCRGTLVTRVEGYFTEEAGALIDAKARGCVVTDGSLLGIHDWWEVDDYAAATRVRMTNTGREMRGHTEGIHILLRSKLIALAVQTASLVLRNITVYSDRHDWERFLRTTLRTRPPK